MVTLGAGSKVTLFNSAGTADVVVDVVGWYGDAPASGSTGRYTPLVPARILDTRTDVPLPGGASMVVQVTGQGGVPSSGVSAVILAQL